MDGEAGRPYEIENIRQHANRHLLLFKQMQVAILRPSVNLHLHSSSASLTETSC
jgi:hypothetical protein